MRKSDQSIKNIVTAAIKRHAIEIENWQNTKLWDSFSESTQLLIEETANFKAGELAILAYFESTVYWYVITTQGIIVHSDSETIRIEAADIENYKLGDFKGIRGQKTEMMHLTLKDGKTTGFSYETGSPSMGAIYGIMTLLTVGNDRGETAV